MPCPCTNGAEIKTGLLNCLAPLCPDFLHGTPPHTDAPAPAHMLCLYFKLTAIITPQMSHRQMALPVSLGCSQVPQAPCQNKPSSHLCVPQKTPLGTYFLDALFQPCFLTPFYISPPLINSLSISLRTTCSKLLQSGRFAFQLFCRSVGPFPHSCPL